MAKIAFIIHGKLRGKAKLRQAIQDIFKPEHETEYFLTKSGSHGRNLAMQATAQGYTHLISVGGDGTLNELVNGVMRTRETLGEEQMVDLVLGVLPKGTGNDFARSIGAPSSLAELLQMVENHSCQKVDLGQVEFMGREGKQTRRYFINITDIGIGGEVVERVNHFPSILGKNLAYQLAVLPALLTFRHQPVQVQADSFTYSGNIMSMIAANGRYFGNGLGIAPHANPKDGNLAVVILGQVSVLDYLKHLRRIRNCEVLEHPQVSYYNARNICVEASGKPFPIDMDGDFVGYTPMKVKVLPGALPFLGKI